MFLWEKLFKKRKFNTERAKFWKDKGYIHFNSERLKKIAKIERWFHETTNLNQDHNEVELKSNKPLTCLNYCLNLFVSDVKTNSWKKRSEGLFLIGMFYQWQ